MTGAGYCACGCGQRTNIATKTYRAVGHVKGQPLKYVLGHNRKANTIRTYHATNQNGAEHRRIVERALGHALRRSAPVHHVNGDRRDNSAGNLVACDSIAYHNLLHRRQRALDECGDPNKRRCQYCRQYDDPKNMRVDANPRICAFHQRCKSEHDSRRRNAA